MRERPSLERRADDGAEPKPVQRHAERRLEKDRREEHRRDERAGQRRGQRETVGEYRREDGAGRAMELPNGEDRHADRDDEEGLTARERRRVHRRLISRQARFG